MNVLVPKGRGDGFTACRMDGSKIGRPMFKKQRQSRANHKVWRQLESIYSNVKIGTKRKHVQQFILKQVISITSQSVSRN